jgi:penicillin G amidase
VRAFRVVAGWIRRILVALVVLATLGTIAAVGLVTGRGLPQTSGTLRVPGLHAPVTVARDASGIIQITAGDPHDLFVGQGYVHAQERMWQMEVSRRIGAGRLSELFGSAEVDTDRYIRTLGWRQAAQRDLDALSADVKDAMQAYADGVNAWIDQHAGSLSMPFVVAGLLSGTGGAGGLTLEPWTTLDTATWQKVQAWSLGGNVDSEIFRMLADARLGDPKLTDQLFPPYDADAPIITPSVLLGGGPAAAAPAAPGSTAVAPAGLAPAGPTPAAAASTAWAKLASIGGGIAALAGFDDGSGLVGDHGVGSNNWVVAGSRTASGKPLLANDPHLGFSMPSVWIMNGLHCRTVSADCPWDVVGVSFPGAPAVILGHNARIAWGATNVGPDTQDLFRETVDPNDPTHYVSGGRSNAFEVRHEVIKVAGEPDVTLDVRSTVHGPILNDVSEQLADQPLLALQWTSTRETDRTLESFFRIDVAGSFDEFRKAFETYNSPSQNFVYADVDGHIGYVLPGLIPLRRDVTDGTRPRDGNSIADDWAGYIPRDQLPWQLDPEGGLIVSANNQPVDAAYPFPMGTEWDPGYRAARIRALLESHKTPLTRADLGAIQVDTYVLRTDKAIPGLLALRPAPATADGRLLLDRITAWDRTCPVDSTGCTAYLTWEFLVQRAIFDAKLGPLARDYVGSPPSWQALIALLGAPTDPWWTAGPGGRPDAATVVAGALDEAGRQLRAAFGDPARWSWGRLHTVTFRESTLGVSGIAPLEWYFDSPSRPIAGADGAINNEYYRFSPTYPDPYDPSSTPVSLGHAFDVSNGPSYRLTIDMADLDAGRIVITTGQSGNPFDRHYGDLIDAWASGGTVPLPFSPGAIEAATVSTLTLQP